MSTPTPSEPTPSERWPAEQPPITPQLPVPSSPASAPHSRDSAAAANLPRAPVAGDSAQSPPGPAPTWNVARRAMLSADDLGYVPRRRRVLPILLFIATCLSTFWVGAADWKPQQFYSVDDMLRAMTVNWRTGLTYMGAVVAILLTHEMGHFLQTVRYRIPASYPLCIPVPFSLIGTMGAVISMDGMRANRKQIFDIGIAGPLAGLAVAIPILCIGVSRLDLSVVPAGHDIKLYNPVLVRWLIQWMRPEWADRAAWVSVSQLNPFFMAGWVGMLITGLNMLPVSQLDGGHTIYALFGRDAYKLARAFTIIAIAYVVLNLEQAAIWTPMLILVIIMGIHHPPTADDNVQLDDFRWILGVASMSIPVLCFPLEGLKQ
jgi:membrane-associated protease RseP (regulator of RpoE activity)